MQLTKLEVKGFKSFGDKITINFNEGVTAIVGPNGCGKSNVVDAIRWVLGEQSTRMLRSEKMENIIFNGTKNRKASNLAEVSLTFDNTKNVLPTEFSHVTITRKLYRSGESEYRLNDVKCRLKDITDLFLDTGIGPDSYSIIELRMIDEIINNKENSRRNLFEEASGISKYKIRKRQTLNRLKETQTDLDRVEDLLFEIEKNLKTLENQAKKTERYYKIKASYKEISVELARLRLQQFNQAFETLESEKNTQQDAQTQLTARINTLEAGLQALKLETLVLEKNLATQQKVTNAHIAKIRTYESDKKVKNEQLRHLQSLETRLQAETTQDRQQLNHVAYNIKRLNEESVVEQEHFAAVQRSLQEKKDEMDALRGQQQSLKGKVDQASRETAAKQQEIYTLEKEITVLGIQKDALEQESLRNLADTESKETELDQFNHRVNELQAELESVQDQHSTIGEEEKVLQTQWTQAEEQIVRLKEEINRQNRMLDAKQNEYSLTKSLVDNLEGFPESIRFLRKKATWKEAYPLFSDILFCKEEYRIAIENYLDGLMNHYVVDTLEEAIHAIHLLNDSSRGRAQFFVLDSVAAVERIDGAHAVDHQALIPALDIISVEEKYLPLCQLLLKDIYLLRDPLTEEYINLPYPDAVILHPEGKFGKEKWGIGGGSIGLFEGKRIGRAKNLENLAKEIKKGNEQVKRQEEELADLKARIINWKAASQKNMLEELSQKLQRLNSELISVKTKQEQYLSFIANSQNRKQDIADKLAQITQELAVLTPGLGEKKLAKFAVDDALRELQEDYRAMSDDLTDKSSLFNQENLRFHQQQNKLTGIEKDLDYRESQKETFEQRLHKNLAEYEATKTAIQAVLEHVDDSDEDLLEMYHQKEDFEQGVKSMEEEYFASREKIAAAEGDIATLRKSKEQTDADFQSLKDRETQIRIDLNGLKERLSVEFDLDIRDLMEEKDVDTDHPSEAQEHFDEDQLTEKTAKLKKQLDDFGSINPMAMEAYQEMSERHTFIGNEKQDLIASKNSLLDTIAEIDLVAKTQFLDAFHKVRGHFIEVFRSLFNAEDSCDLVLTDPDNPLESDIDIIARPKGKRPLSINQLSGGEKTLTSTALLFSLYLLKPAPFCIFDEVDAPLDDSNIDKFNNIIRKFSSQSQFIIVSHNKRTIASTDIIYGVTMVEQGVSRVVAVDLRAIA